MVWLGVQSWLIKWFFEQHWLLLCAARCVASSKGSSPMGRTALWTVAWLIIYNYSYIVCVCVWCDDSNFKRNVWWFEVDMDQFRDSCPQHEHPRWWPFFSCINSATTNIFFVVLMSNMILVNDHSWCCLRCSLRSDRQRLCDTVYHPGSDCNGSRCPLCSCFDATCFWVSLVWCDSGFSVFLDEPWSWHSMKPRWNNHPARNSSTGHMCNGWFTFSCLSFDDWTLNALVVITCCNHSRKPNGQRLSGGYVSNTWLWWVFGQVEHDHIYRKVFLLDLSWMSTYNHFTAKPSYIFGSPWAP